MIPLLHFLTNRLPRQLQAARPFRDEWWPSLSATTPGAEAGAERRGDAFPPTATGTLPALMARTQAHLRELLARHGDLASRVEPDFIHLGASLQELACDAGRLTECITAVVGLLGNEERGVLADMRHLAERSLRELTDGRLAIDTSLEQVETISSRLDAFIRLAADLERLGLNLRVVGVTIGVESTRSREANALFSTESQAVVQLAETIRDLATQITRDCHEVRAGQQQILVGIGQSRQRLAGLSREAGQAVQKAVSELQAVMGRAVTTLRDAEVHARVINEQIGVMVMRVQLHDRMSQCLAHSAEALAEVIHTLTPPAAVTGDDARQKLLAKARRIMLLQGGQISRQIEELTEARGRGSEAFRLIASQVEALGDSLSPNREARISDHGDLPRADTITVLRQAIARLGLMVADGSTMLERIHAAARQASTMTNRLNGRMHDIEEIGFTIHLKALNAIAKAAGLGSQGRPLEVLAQETKKLSDRARACVAQAEAIHAATTNSVTALDAVEQQQAGTGLAAGQALDLAVQAIAETLTAFNHDAAQVTDQALALHRQVLRAEDGVTFMDRVMAELHDYREQLTAGAADIEPFVAGCDEDDIEAGAARLQERYTMDHERQLHAAFFGGPPAAGEAPPPESDVLLFAADDAEAATAETTELGDNVELF